jgi:hypothetical protein
VDLRDVAARAGEARPASASPSELAAENLEALARKACASSASSTDWTAYIEKLQPLVTKS